MSELDDAADFIVQYFPELTGGRLFVGEEGDRPTDPCVTIYEWLGPPPIRIQDQLQPAIAASRFRVICRSVDYQAARDLLGHIRAACWQRETYLNGRRYLGIQPVTTIFPMNPPDASDRVSPGFVLEMQGAY